MKVRIVSVELALEIFVGSNVLVQNRIFTAHHNYKKWQDESGRTYAYEILLQEEGRSWLGWWAHHEEVELLRPSEELAHALGKTPSTAMSDGFAEEVLLYAAENEISAGDALRIVIAKDLRVVDPEKPKENP